MNYKIKKDILKNSVILVRSRISERILSAIILSFGIPALIAGILMIIFPEGEAYFQYAIAGFGLVFTSGGIMLLTQLNAPERIIFNNSEGRIRLIEKNGENCEIPYQDIDKFQVNKFKAQRSRESFNVDMIKNDGAIWTLFSSQSSKKADSFYTEIMENIDLSIKSESEISYTTPGNVTLTAAPEGTVISWKKKNSVPKSILGLMILAGFTMTVYGFTPGMAGSLKIYIAYGFISLIYILVIFYIITSFHRTYFIKISEGSVHHYSEGTFGKGYSFEIPASGISSVNFFFSMASGDSCIYFFTGDELEFMRKVKLGLLGLDDIIEAIFKMKKIRKIIPGDLNTSEKVSLEMMIQREIEKICRVKVR